MALVQCNNCGRRISSLAKSCPKCGAPPRSIPAGSGAPVGAEEPKGEPTEGPHRVPLARIHLAKSAVPVPPEPPPLSGQEEQAEEWYYVKGGSRVGPVRFSLLVQLVNGGELLNDAPIWKPGLSDWVKFVDYVLREEEALPEPQEPHPFVEEKTQKGSKKENTGSYYGWALALAPLWGGAIQIVATEGWIALTHQRLSYYAQLWWLVICLNILVAFLDYRSLKHSGRDLGSLQKWLFVLVPVYFYRREKVLNARRVRLMVWGSCCAASFACLFLLNGVYARITPK